MSKKSGFNYKKLGLQVIIALLIYFVVEWTLYSENEGHGFYDQIATFYLISALFFVIGTWAVNDWLVYRQLKSGKGFDFRNSMRLLLLNFVIVLPVFLLVYYLSNYILFEEMYMAMKQNPDIIFRIDVLRAAIIALIIIVFNIFYHSMQQKKSMEHAMDRLQKELVTSKYQSLKSQISPHFLFNSLNTLTSLMYEDRDLASDFVSRLATSYRYILDNREEDLVPLKKELDFLDSFIFMMNVRHEGAIDIKIDISIDTNLFMVPTLSLQMLVDNAMKHNYFSREKPLHIHVRSEGRFSLTVENTLRIRETGEESTKLGIDNIKKRYLCYTEQDVIVETKDNLFIVTMPLLIKSEIESTVLSMS